MKKTRFLSLLLVAVVLVGFMPAANVLAVNPYLPLWEFIPDGEPYVFEDPDNPGKYRFYIYGSHDTLETEYCGRDFVLWSAPVEDLSDLRYHGVLFESKTNRDGTAFSVADILYAPDVQEVIEDGKKVYYLYPNNQASGRGTMVAKSDRPDGPFTVINWSSTNANQTTGAAGFDPAVFVDDDGRAYMYYGFQRSYGVELDSNMYSAKAGASVVNDLIPSIGASDAGQDPQHFRYYEAPSMRKIDGAYILVYARGGRAQDEIGGGGASQLAYAYSFESPLGPFTYGGILINASGEHVKANGEPATDTIDNMGSFYGHNTHGGLVNINGQWFITYHRAINNHGYSRQATMEACTIIVDKENKTVTIPETEMTSEGWQTSGLDPYKNYSAGISCYLTGGAYIVANRDVEANSNIIAETRNGSVVGYKYFNFSKNAPAGQSTYLDIGFVPAGIDGFIDVYLDRPNTISGTMIGSIEISAGMPRDLINLRLPVPAIDSLDGKHAVFLKFRHNAGSASMGNLFDIEFTASADPNAPLYYYVRLSENPIDIDEEITISVLSKYADGTELDHSAAASITANTPGIATYADGKIKGVSAGTATFDVTYGSFSQTISVIVYDPAVPLSTTVELGATTVKVEATTTLKVLSTYSKGRIVDHTADATVVARNESIATYADGIITGVSAGTANFDVTFGSFSKSVAVTVRADDWTNYALASNGASIELSDGWEGTKESINDGVRTVSTGRIRWGQPSGDNIHWMEINLDGMHTIRRINLISQMRETDTGEPTYQTTTNLGLRTVRAYYWNGEEWVLISTNSNTQNYVIQQFSPSSDVVTDKIRFEFPNNSTNNGWVRVIEAEVWGEPELSSLTLANSTFQADMDAVIDADIIGLGLEGLEIAFSIMDMDESKVIYAFDSVLASADQFSAQLLIPAGDMTFEGGSYKLVASVSGGSTVSAELVVVAEQEPAPLEPEASFDEEGNVVLRFNGGMVALENLSVTTMSGSEIDWDYNGRSFVISGLESGEIIMVSNVIYPDIYPGFVFSVAIRVD